jgi:hypothetical protein
MIMNPYHLIQSRNDGKIPPSGQDIQWSMKDFFAKDSPRGIWEITDKGKKFYEENKNR